MTRYIPCLGRQHLVRVGCQQGKNKKGLRAGFTVPLRNIKSHRKVSTDLPTAPGARDASVTNWAAKVGSAENVLPVWHFSPGTYVHTHQDFTMRAMLPRRCPYCLQVLRTKETTKQRFLLSNKTAADFRLTAEPQQGEASGNFGFGRAFKPGHVNAQRSGREDPTVPWGEWGADDPCERTGSMQNVLDAMGTLGFAENEIDGLLNGLSAVCYLSQVGFVHVARREDGRLGRKLSLSNASSGFCLAWI